MPDESPIGPRAISDQQKMTIATGMTTNALERQARATGNLRGATAQFKRELASYLSEVRKGTDTGSAHMRSMQSSMQAFVAAHGGLKEGTKEWETYYGAVASYAKGTSDLQAQKLREQVVATATAIAAMKGMEKAGADEMIAGHIAVARSADAHYRGEAQELGKLQMIKAALGKAEFSKHVELVERETELTEKYNLDAAAAYGKGSAVAKMELAKRIKIAKEADNTLTKLTQAGGLTGMVARGLGRTSLGSTLLRQEAAESRGQERRMGLHSVVGGAASELKGMSEAFGPLIQKIGMAIGGFAIMGKLVESVIAGFDRGRRVGGQMLQAQVMMTNQNVDRLGVEAMAQRDLWAAAMGGWREVLTMSAMLGAGLEDEIVPAAAQATMQFGRMEGQAAAFTASFTRIAGIGALAGKDMQGAMQAAVEGYKAFGSEAPDVESIFRRQAAGARMAGLAFDELAESMGGIVDLGKMWGNQSKSYETIARMLHSGGKGSQLEGMSQAQRQLAVETVSGMMRWSPAKHVGFQMAATGGALGASVNALIAGARGGDMAGYALKNLRGVIQRQGLGRGLMEGASGEQKFTTAAAISSMANRPELFGAILTSPVIRAWMRGVKVNEQELADAFDEAQTPAEKGYALMSSQKGAMEQIVGILSELLVFVGEIVASELIQSGPVKMMAGLLTPGAVAGRGLRAVDMAPQQSPDTHRPGQLDAMAWR